MAASGADAFRSPSALFEIRETDWQTRALARDFWRGVSGDSCRDVRRVAKHLSSRSVLIEDPQLEMCEVLIADAQRELRSVYRSGSIGLFVSAFVWLMSAALTTWVSTRFGIVAMLIGGFFIYPMTQLVLRAMGGRASLPTGNPMRELAFEVAVVGPLMLPLIGAAALYRVAWFYPAFMIAIGAHYLPFAFLYGRRQFLGLGVIMLVVGLIVGAYMPRESTMSAWFTAGLLIVFGFTSLRAHASEQLEDVRFVA